MENKNYLKYLVIGSFVLLVLLVFEFFIFKPEVKDKDAEKLVEKQYIEHVNTTVASDTEEIYIFLNGIVDLMNQKDYKTLYSLLREDYKKLRFSNYDDFTRYMDNYLLEQYVPKYGSYTRNNGIYSIIVEFLKREYTRDDLLSGVGVKTDTISLVKDDETAFKFALGGFIESKEPNTSVKVNDVEFTLSRVTRYAEESEAKVIITNNSKNTLYVESKNFIVDLEGGNTSVTSVLPLTSIKEGESKLVNIKYFLKKDSLKTLRSIKFVGLRDSTGKVFDEVTLKAK